MPPTASDLDAEEQLFHNHGRRLFSRLMKEECWRKHEKVPGRDGDRWRYDASGRLVCRALTGCVGPLCYEYDHIIPFSKGIFIIIKREQR